MSIAEKIGKFAYVPSHRKFFSDRGQYFARGAKTPQAGDIVIFQNESHIGIVEYVSGGYVHTIEGNTSGGSTLVANGGGVFQKTYSLSSGYIQGYGRPAYAAGEAAKIVNVAKSEVGYLEKRSNAQLDDKTANAGSNNYTKYGRWYGMNGQPWCDMFVSWCAAMADSGAASGGTAASASTPKTEIRYSPWKTVINGNSVTPVYRNTNRTKAIGSLNPGEKCESAGRYGDSISVFYANDEDDDDWYVGYVDAAKVTVK